MAKGETETETVPREYVVLKRKGPIECDIVGSFLANSARQAVDAARKGEGGRWVAVASSRWNEEDLEVVQREPTVKRTKIDPAQSALFAEAPTEVVAA